MTRDDLIAVSRQEIKGLSAYFEVSDYSNAVDEAERDTGWTLPQTTAFKIKWLKQRTKRHLLSFLQLEAAYKFQYKQIHQEHRFKHLTVILESMDKDFVDAQEESPHEFADVSAYEMFGHRVTSGFRTEPQTGRDLTYDTNARAMIHPSDDG